MNDPLHYVIKQIEQHLPAERKRVRPDPREEALLQEIGDTFREVVQAYPGYRCVYIPRRTDGPWGHMIYHGDRVVAQANVHWGQIRWSVFTRYPNPEAELLRLHDRSHSGTFDLFGQAIARIVAENEI